MLAEGLRTLYDYNDWANARIFAAAANLSQEQFDTPGAAGHGAIHETLLHLINTQGAWLSWWDGSLAPEAAMRTRFVAADHPDVAVVRAAWEQVTAQTRAFLSDLSDEDAQRLYTSTPPGRPAWTSPLWKMMLHVANHGTQHRSEIATMLTNHGHSPGDLDLLFYLLRPGADQ